MKIYLNVSTAGRYGGGLNGKLRFIPNLIQQELNNSKFTSSFHELWLTLYYPPMYVLSGVKGMEVTFMKYYKTLPSSRLDRRYKKVTVDLQAPEFSEHLDKPEQFRHKYKFTIDEKYKNLSDLELAHFLLDKYIEVGHIISSKTKKEDTFNFEIYKNVILSIKETVSKKFLKKTYAEQKIKSNNEIISHALEIRDQRKKSDKPKNKKIRDIRVYSYGLPKRALYPYDYQYAEIFLNLLRREEVMCPVYHHLYVQVVKTLEDGLSNSLAIEDWYTNGISVFDYEKYSKQNDKGKERMVFEAIVTGIKDIATLDKLDIKKINKVAAEIKKTGLDTELVFDKVENSRYILTITYFSRSMEEQCPIYFHVKDKKTNRSNKIQIGKATNDQIYLWLQKVMLGKDKIKVRSSTSIAANVYLKGKPRTMEIIIADIIKIE